MINGGPFRVDKATSQAFLLIDRVWVTVQAGWTPIRGSRVAQRAPRPLSRTPGYWLNRPGSSSAACRCYWSTNESTDRSGRRRSAAQAKPYASGSAMSRRTDHGIMPHRKTSFLYDYFDAVHAL